MIACYPLPCGGMLHRSMRRLGAQAQSVTSSGAALSGLSAAPKATARSLGCLKRLSTNENGTLHRGMDAAMEFRTISTHFVADGYGLFFGSVLQQAVHDCEGKHRELIEICDRITVSCLALPMHRDMFDLDAIRRTARPRSRRRCSSSDPL